MIHMDGTSPSGFTDSCYKGLTAEVDPKCSSKTYGIVATEDGGTKDDGTKDDGTKDDGTKTDDNKDGGTTTIEKTTPTTTESEVKDGYNAEGTLVIGSLYDVLTQSADVTAFFNNIVNNFWVMFVWFDFGLW